MKIKKFTEFLNEFEIEGEHQEIINDISSSMKKELSLGAGLNLNRALQDAIKNHTNIDISDIRGGSSNPFTHKITRSKPFTFDGTTFTEYYTKIPGLT